MTGSMTLSSKLPLAPASVIVASLPMTCAHTMSVASGMTGLTLPGMMLEPGCRSGRWISPSPARGPELIQRRSLQILVRLTATTLAAPLTARPARPGLAWASKWLSASRSGMPVSSASTAVTAAANPGAALRPVPAAVPPSGSSAASCGGVAAPGPGPSPTCRA